MNEFANSTSDTKTTTQNQPSTNTFFQATRFDYKHPLITLIASHCFLPTIQEHKLTNSRGKGENKQSKLGELTTQNSQNRMNPFNPNKLTH